MIRLPHNPWKELVKIYYGSLDERFFHSKYMNSNYVQTIKTFIPQNTFVKFVETEQAESITACIHAKAVKVKLFIFLLVIQL